MTLLRLVLCTAVSFAVAHSPARKLAVNVTTARGLQVERCDGTPLPGQLTIRNDQLHIITFPSPTVTQISGVRHVRSRNDVAWGLDSTSSRTTVSSYLACQVDLDRYLTGNSPFYQFGSYYTWTEPAYDWCEVVAVSNTDDFECSSGGLVVVLSCGDLDLDAQNSPSVSATRTGQSSCTFNYGIAPGTDFPQSSFSIRRGPFKAVTGGRCTNGADWQCPSRRCMDRCCFSMAMHHACTACGTDGRCAACANGFLLSSGTCVNTGGSGGGSTGGSGGGGGGSVNEEINENVQSEGQDCLKNARNWQARVACGGAMGTSAFFASSGEGIATIVCLVCLVVVVVVGNYCAKKKKEGAPGPTTAEIHATVAAEAASMAEKSSTEASTDPSDPVVVMHDNKLYHSPAPVPQPVPVPAGVVVSQEPTYLPNPAYAVASYPPTAAGARV